MQQQNGNAPYLNRDEAAQILHAVLTPGPEDICLKEEACHACAALAATTATAAIRTAILRNLDVVAGLAGNIHRERNFVLESVEKNLVKLRRVAGVLDALLVQLGKRPYCVLPEAESLREELKRTHSIVLLRGAEPMQAFLDSELERDKRGRERRIEKLFERLVHVVTIAAHHPGMLVGMAQRTRRMKRRLRSDWRRDLNNIRYDETCEIHRTHGDEGLTGRGA